MNSNKRLTITFSLKNHLITVLNSRSRLFWIVLIFNKPYSQYGCPIISAFFKTKLKMKCIQSLFKSYEFHIMKWCQGSTYLVWSTCIIKSYEMMHMICWNRRKLQGTEIVRRLFVGDQFWPELINELYSRPFLWAYL